MTERAFVAIPASQVDPAIRRRALEASEAGAKRLGIEKVLLIWVEPASGQTPAAARHVQPGHYSGWTYEDSPGVIFIRADLPRHVRVTVLHELRHLAQRRDGRPFDEDDAEQWARRVLQTHLEESR